jgi:hypothetical protein
VGEPDPPALEQVVYDAFASLMELTSPGP